MDIMDEMVSPGLLPRPSLSDRNLIAGRRRDLSVAGVTAPAFVERAVAAAAGFTTLMCRRGYCPGLR